jgi:hypothetical protein
MRLIPDARLAWRFDTVQAAALLALLSAVQAELLPLVQPLVPVQWWPYVSGAVALAIILLRVRQQPALEAERAQHQAQAALQTDPALQADREAMDRMERASEAADREAHF